MPEFARCKGYGHQWHDLPYSSLVALELENTIPDWAADFAPQRCAYCTMVRIYWYDRNQDYELKYYSRPRDYSATKLDNRTEWKRAYTDNLVKSPKSAKPAKVTAKKSKRHLRRVS